MCRSRRTTAPCSASPPMVSVPSSTERKNCPRSSPSMTRSRLAMCDLPALESDTGRSRLAPGYKWLRDSCECGHAQFELVTGRCQVDLRARLLGGAAAKGWQILVGGGATLAEEGRRGLVDVLGGDTSPGSGRPAGSSPAPASPASAPRRPRTPAWTTSGRSSTRCSRAGRTSWCSRWRRAAWTGRSAQSLAANLPAAHGLSRDLREQTTERGKTDRY